jgi:hypothetical protein
MPQHSSLGFLFFHHLPHHYTHQYYLWMFESHDKPRYTLIICRRYAEIAEHGRHTPLWAARHRVRGGGDTGSTGSQMIIMIEIHPTLTRVLTANVERLACRGTLASTPYEVQTNTSQVDAQPDEGLAASDSNVDFWTSPRLVSRSFIPKHFPTRCVRL